MTNLAAASSNAEGGGSASNRTSNSERSESSAAPGRPDARGRRVRSVDHAIDILQTLAAAPSGLGVSDVARRVALSKASVYHLLSTLESRHLVAREPGASTYRLGWGLYELGQTVVRSSDVTRVARHFLDDLAHETGESTLLGIYDEDAVLYLDRGDPPTGLRMVANSGRRSPLHTTASGKVLVASSTDPEIEARLLSGALPKATRATITDPKILRKELSIIRKQGYATCWEEREVGLCSIAVPIRDYSGGVVASLAVAGPSTRVNARTIRNLLGPLRKAGQQIERQIGHREDLHGSL